MAAAKRRSAKFINDPNSPRVFGLLSQTAHRRPIVAKNEKVADRRERQNRESLLGQQGVQACGPAPEGDRVCGADTFEFLQFLSDGGHDFAVCFRHNRALILYQPRARVALYPLVFERDYGFQT